MCRRSFNGMWKHRNVRFIFRNIRPEKCFVESTKIWLAQKKFSFKYGIMEILFELTKYMLFIFFFNSNKIVLHCQQKKKKWNYKLKLQNHCRVKKTDFVNSSKT